MTATAPTPAATHEFVPAAGPTTRHVHACPLCEAMCGLVIETQGPEVTSIRGDADDPFSRGHVCPKAVALKDLHEDPDRLRQPMKRIHDRWEPVGWKEALDFAADGLKTVTVSHNLRVAYKVLDGVQGAALDGDTFKVSRAIRFTENLRTALYKFEMAPSNVKTAAEAVSKLQAVSASLGYPTLETSAALSRSGSAAFVLTMGTLDLCPSRWTVEPLSVRGCLRGNRGRWCMLRP